MFSAQIAKVPLCTPASLNEKIEIQKRAHYLRRRVMSERKRARRRFLVFSSIIIPLSGCARVINAKSRPPRIILTLPAPFREMKV